MQGRTNSVSLLRIRTGDHMFLTNSSVLTCGSRTGDSSEAKAQVSSTFDLSTGIHKSETSELHMKSKLLTLYLISAAGSTTAATKEEKIAALEEECLKLKAKSMTTTSGNYGMKPKAVKDLEMFSMKHNNIQKDPDLMPCPRRPPKK